MLSPRTPCETGVIFCGTKHPESTKDKFPRYTYLVHLLGFGEWHLSPLWAPPCEDSHINAISSPHLKLQKKKKVPGPALHDHCALLYSVGCHHHKAQPEAGWMHFQTWSTFKTSRERKVLWWALMLSRGRPEEHRWFWSHGPNWKTSAFHYLTIHENEHKGGFHLKRSTGVIVGR